MSEEGFPSRAPIHPIRFGVLCDGPKIPTWQVRTIQELRRVPGTSLALLVFPEEGSLDGSRPVGLLFRAYVASHAPRALRPVDMALALPEVPSLTGPAATQRGGSHSEPGAFGPPFTPSDKTLTRCTSGLWDGRRTCAKTSAWARPHT